MLVEESIAERFLAASKALFEGIRAKAAARSLELSTDYAPVVDKLQFDRVMSYIESGKTSAQLVTGGKRLGSQGCFIEPTIFLNPDPKSRIWREEIFGPVLTVRTFKTEEEAITMANDSVYGLAGESALTWPQRIRVCFNDHGGDKFLNTGVLFSMRLHL